MLIETWLLLALAVLQICDAWTTYHIIRAGGRERNPLMRWFIERLGLLPGLIVPKAVIVTALALAVPYMGSAAPYVLLAACALYGLVVLHNFRIIR